MTVEVDALADAPTLSAPLDDEVVPKLVREVCMVLSTDFICRDADLACRDAEARFSISGDVRKACMLNEGKDDVGFLAAIITCLLCS